MDRWQISILHCAVCILGLLTVNWERSQDTSVGNCKLSAGTLWTTWVDWVEGEGGEGGGGGGGKKVREGERRGGKGERRGGSVRGGEGRGEEGRKRERRGGKGRGGEGERTWGKGERRWGKGERRGGEGRGRGGEGERRWRGGECKTRSTHRRRLTRWVLLIFRVHFRLSYSQYHSWVVLGRQSEVNSKAERKNWKVRKKAESFEAVYSVGVS